MADAADSEVKTSQSSSGTGATQADVGSATRGAQSQSTTQAESVTDVGQGEAYIINMKRLVAQELDGDKLVNAQMQRLLSSAVTMDNQLQNLALQSLQNAVNLQNRVNNNAVDNDGRKTGNDEQYDKAVDQVSVDELTKMAEAKKPA